MILPPAYAWLKSATLPAPMAEGFRMLGTAEKAGPSSNPVIVDWAREIGVTYNGDDIPWCGLFMALCVHRAYMHFPDHPLWALNWAGFGNLTARAALGDVLVFTRPGTNGHAHGHVGFYVQEDADAFSVLGGNQSDAVSITRVPKSRLVAARVPPYEAEPETRRQVIASSDGTPISQSEA